MNCFGITKDISSNYMFVTKYFEDGDYLYSRIDEVHGILDWKNIVEILWVISGNIEYIDELKYPVDSNKIYGVLPYMAPEILRGNLPTKYSDIYSFGIIMWMLITGIRPWCNRPNDLKLANEICFGLR